MKFLQRAQKTMPGRFLTRLVRRYFAHDVGRQSAALAYFLLFTIFPLLIFLSSLLGLLALDVNSIITVLQPLLPAAVLELLEMYLLYVGETSSRTMLWFGLIFTIYFPMRAADCLMMAVRRAYRLDPPKNQIIYMAKVLLYTVFLLTAVALILFLATIGQHALQFLERIVDFPEGFIAGWGGLRFLIMAAVIFGAVGLLYAVSLDSRQPSRRVLPGALCALGGWMLVSAVFSFYVENFANYSVIYGTLGAFIVLLIWLSLTATILIMGAEINDTLTFIHDPNAPPLEPGTGELHLTKKTGGILKQ